MVEPLDSDSSETAALLNSWILKSQTLLENHPVNLKRKAAGKDPANSLWPWSPGYKPQMPTFKEMYDIQKSAVISAVDLIQGIGVYAGMEVIKVDGATGLYNTNNEARRSQPSMNEKRGRFVFSTSRPATNLVTWAT
jgi:2,3-bisphosphoglycerate-independent phosphoglycerate mutase